LIPNVLTLAVQGTIIVILGVIGIVAFGSINSGLATETDVKHLTHLWRRPGWLGFFFLMTFALLLLLLFTIKLDEVLVSRNDVSSVPFAGSGGGMANGGNRSSKATSTNGFVKAYMKLRLAWQAVSQRISEYLEMWTVTKDDQTIAWILGIGWACNGGGLAGGTLVFAKATYVKCSITFLIFTQTLANLSSQCQVNFGVALA
jgi:magnesium transporter